ncbi:MAG: FHA domain-containing protein [Pirellulales bacterium]
MQIQLKVLSGSSEGRLVPVTHEKFLIGRSDECQLRPKSDSISRRHCAFIQKDDKLLLIDLKSRNGTFVNDKQLDPSRAKVLKHGDKIRVGKLEFELILQVEIAKKKKPEVKDVKEAAARSAENTGDSRYEEVDVSSWLEEADQIKRDRSGDPVTRQFMLSDSAKLELPEENTIVEAQAEKDTKTGKPGKLPKTSSKPSTANSKDAASETLRKFFGGR